MERRRLLEQLELLCQCGAGVEAIAPSACEIFRQLAAADSGSVFWLDATGAPGGFYHDCAPVEIKDFFVANFEAMFSNPEEPNMVSMLRPIAPAIGQALQPGWLERYRASNVYTYLAGPLGHEFMFDIRVDVGRQGRLLLCGWNRAGRPFGQRHLADAAIIHDLLRQALEARSTAVQWRSVGSRSAHFITDLAAHALLSIDQEAEDLLRSAHLLQQNIPMRDALREAPHFARDLAAMVRAGETAELAIPVAAGRLSMRAVLSRVRGATGGDGAGQMLVLVDRQQADSVAAIDFLSAQPLTMLQKRIALHAMHGGERRDCETLFGASAEALKKHLNAIYAALQVDGWGDLAQFDGHRAALPA